MDGIGAGPVCIGYMPPGLTPITPAALWLTTEGARAILAAERKVICKKAGMELATDIARARWRKEKGVVIAESGYFAYTFTASPDGWRLTGCRMLWTARTELRPYLHIFGDFSHASERGVLPDFHLRDLTQEEIEESGLQQGAVLSVSSLVIKQMGRFHTRKTLKREKKMRAILNDWSARDTGALQSVVRLKAKPEKNAWVISGGTGKRG